MANQDLSHPFAPHAGSGIFDKCWCGQPKDDPAGIHLVPFGKHRSVSGGADTRNPDVPHAFQGIGKPARCWCDRDEKSAVHKPISELGCICDIVFPPACPVHYSQSPDPKLFEMGYRPGETRAMNPLVWEKGKKMAEEEEDWVNPSHYNENGPTIECPQCGHKRTLRCIELMRRITEPRLATAVRYIWRVAFGGKKGQPPERDVDKARWYLQDWLNEPPEIKP